MKSILEIKSRLKSVKKIQQITRAMKMVSAVKFRRAQAALLENRMYAHRLRDVMINVMGQCDAVSHPLLHPRPVKNILFIVATSDKGLCGSFNSNMLRSVQRALREFSSEDVRQSVNIGLLLIGRKAQDFFKRTRGDSVYKIVQQVMFADVKVDELSQMACDAYAKGEWDQIDLFFTEFKSVMHQRAVRERLLPLLLPTTENAKAKSINYLYEPEPEELIADLFRRYLHTQMRRMVLESSASEQGARLSMMDQASKNAEDMIEQLQLSYNKARQLSITRELADITTGAEAMA